MCAVSYVGDYFKKRLPEEYPWAVPLPAPHPTPYNPYRTYITQYPTIQEFEKLKKEVEELKKLLEAAKIFDKQTNQPDCEMDEKVELIKKIAEYVGVDLKDVFK